MICENDGLVLGGVQFGVLVRALFGGAVWGAVGGARQPAQLCKTVRNRDGSG